MILIIHQENRPIQVFRNKEELTFESKKLSSLLFELSNRFLSELIIWCHKDLKEYLNVDDLNQVFNHSLIMASFSTSKTTVISDSIGYIDQTPFINVNYETSYPTWRMSSDIGGVNSQVLRLMIGKVNEDLNFEYFLNSLAKIAMPNGLFCYSEPKLLIKNAPLVLKKKRSIVTLFKFVKQHYKTRWMLILSFNYLIYKGKISIISFLYALFYKNRIRLIDFKDIHIQTPIKYEIFDLDVVIPTIGREKYLYNVLLDLNEQSILPKNVIIIEQNSDESSNSNLDYLQSELWKFEIKHQFTHQIGACNSRNMALKNVTSNWVFFADDDIRIQHHFIEKSFNEINKYGVKAITVSCLMKDEIEKYNFLFQWPTFGSGCSIVNVKKINNSKFDMAFEHGFGEDADFGMQLRNQGVDVIYVPTVQLLHLKASIGGFRTKFVHQWEKDITQPKPSPTVMLYKQKYNSSEQLLGFKTLLFFKFYRLQSIKNPFKYFQTMRNRWNVSKKWSEILEKK